MKPSPLKRQSTHDDAYRRLRAALLDGAFPPGQRLTNRDLAEMVGVSVTPVREAIRRLVSEGALLLLPNGSVAAPAINPVLFPEEQGWLLLTLSCRAISLSVDRLTQTDIAKLEATFEHVKAACASGDRGTAARGFHEFYFTIFERTQQPCLVALLDQLWLQCGGLPHETYPAFVAREEGRHYLDMLDALRRRDASGAVAAYAAFHQRLTDFLGSEAARTAPPERGATS